MGGILYGKKPMWHP